MRNIIPTSLCLLVCSLLCGTVFASVGSPAAGSTATLATYYHGVNGTATVLDEQTVKIEHFTYDGGGPAVYFYLGTNASYNAFLNGIPIGNQLTRAYSNETVTVSLPAGQTLEGYNAISVWCAEFKVDFGSGTFSAPPNPELSIIQRTNNVTSLVVAGPVGQSYELQVSSNLSAWVDFESGTNTDGTTEFSDTNELTQRFYRVLVK